MSRGASARLFVAVDPPLAAAEELGEWARLVASGARAGGAARGMLRLLDPSSMHVTLCFLGSRPVGEMDALADALGSCPARPFELSVGAPQWLPPRRPRALAVEVHDRAGELASTHERVSAALAGASSWQPERRRFRPHITLARVRQGAGRGARAADRAARAQPLPATPRLSFTPAAIVLYRSWLAPQGASYEAIVRCPLAGEPLDG
jgi:2'-5' RNA ligase